jgi:acetyl esterase/lipase
MPSPQMQRIIDALRQILLFIHGGGYSLGSLRSHGPLAAQIGRETGRRVLFPEYRLAPEHPFPAAADDVLTAWRWLTAQGARPASVAVAGDSAGGGLTLVLLQALRDSGQAAPAAAVLISPWADLTLSGASMTERAAQDQVFSQPRLSALASDYLNGANPRDHAASPLFGSHYDPPPLLIQAGSAEVLLSDAERLAEATAKDGVHVTLNVADGSLTSTTEHSTPPRPPPPSGRSCSSRTNSPPRLPPPLTTARARRANRPSGGHTIVDPVQPVQAVILGNHLLPQPLHLRCS